MTWVCMGARVRASMGGCVLRTIHKDALCLCVMMMMMIHLRSVGLGRSVGLAGDASTTPRRLDDGRLMGRDDTHSTPRHARC